MKKTFVILFLLSVLTVAFGWPFIMLLSGCAIQTEPAVPPQPHGGTCESVYVNLKKLGGCGMHMETLIENCHDEERNSSVPLPHDCATEAKTCEEFNACS